MSPFAPGPDRGKLTGRKVALIFAAFFGVILAANILLMVHAVGSFSGLVVPNSYVASQSFDRDRAAQEALGWALSASYQDGAFHLSIRNPEERQVRPKELYVTIGRPTTEVQDMRLELLPAPDGYLAPVALDPGNWRVDIKAIAADGTVFVQRRALFVPSSAS